jgi:thiamine-phosphate pyrophosphorylase
MKSALCPIYAITDKELSRCESHLGILKELVRGGAQLVQIRDKSTPTKELLRDLFRCVEFASKHGVTLIVNDRCDLVLSCGAMGVHLGQDDLPPDAARAILGRKTVIGLSAHSLAQVRSARKMPIQYVGFGPVYPTSTKKDAAPAVGLGLLAEACRISSIPVVAIGGIGINQVCEVLQTGACSAAVISALMQARNIAHQMERFLKKATEK